VPRSCSTFISIIAPAFHPVSTRCGVMSPRARGGSTLDSIFFLPILSAIRDLAPRDLCNPSCDPSAVVCCLGQAGFHDSFPCRGATLSCGERKQGSPHPSAKRRSHHRYHLLRHRVRTYNTLHKCGSVVACPAGSLESEPWRRYLPKRRSMKTMKYALSWQHA
jgi:hypothetical protein